MKAIYLIKHGDADEAFEIRETPMPVPRPGEVLIKVEGFGLNFADVMARRGMYKEAPNVPGLIGYDVCGTIEMVGSSVKHFAEGDRVAAMTRFGGYAEYALTDERAVTKIPNNINIAEATTLTTQYCTAYYGAAEMINLHPGDRVLIHSAAGGVGTGLMQYALWKGCEVFATTGSDSKVELLKAQKAHHVINTRTVDFDDYIDEQTKGDGVDVIFDRGGRRLHPTWIFHSCSGWKNCLLWGREHDLCYQYFFYRPHCASIRHLSPCSIYDEFKKPDWG
ncbi:MAG: zinc-binding dehydrogenase [Bacteroidetes bacterium]|nr:zinc-binding dehydrogenase [Bacteroidota bacterium]